MFKGEKVNKRARQSLIVKLFLSNFFFLLSLMRDSKSQCLSSINLNNFLFSFRVFYAVASVGNSRTRYRRLIRRTARALEMCFSFQHFCCFFAFTSVSFACIRSSILFTFHVIRPFFLSFSDLNSCVSFRFHRLTNSQSLNAIVVFI